MSDNKTYKQLEEELRSLKATVGKLEKRGGGMLSSRDFTKRVVRKEKSKKDYEKLRNAFYERNWKEIDREFIIEPFDELQLTPFSYDLSIGNEIFSVRKTNRIRRRLPYDVAPGETVIVLTKEFIALPPCYAATVWPRFNMVKAGIFQSMVKIDPTWYGKLGVAMTNFSPRTIEFKEGKAFGTLVLYELASDPEVYLWQAKDLKPVQIPIPNIPVRAKLQEKLEDRDLTNVCWVEDNSLVVKGLKKPDYDKLREIDRSEPWQETVEKARKSWLEYIDKDTGRKCIGMEALGMEDLEKLIEGPAMGEPLDPEKIRETKVTSDLLFDVALEHGKPFDLIANIPKLVEDIPKLVEEQVDKVVEVTIAKEIGRNVIPRMLQLTISILGFLALIVAIVGLLAGYFQLTFVQHIDIPLALVVVSIVICVVLFPTGLYLFSLKGISKFKKKLEDVDTRLDNKTEKLRKEIEKVKETMKQLKK